MPRVRAEINITRATNLTPLGLLPNLEFCHMFPASAIKVIPIIRIAQINSGLSSKPRRSKKTSGAASKKMADTPKTTAPPFKVFLIPCWYI
ncbi:unannotated protein [freshwater metagenome]|uniref:Unannotated protein n=1 Tax=freshwater metagenome TaxID=449393 RepID=A0A6J5Z006_9ZZZZ